MANIKFLMETIENADILFIKRLTLCRYMYGVFAHFSQVGLCQMYSCISVVLVGILSVESYISLVWTKYYPQKTKKPIFTFSQKET